MIEVFMPKLGPSMEQGTVAHWHKSKGEHVRKGEPIIDIETDKTTVEVEAEADGIVLDILATEGGVYAVGTVLALIGAKGETIAAPKQGVITPVSDLHTEIKPNVTPISAIANDGELERLLIKASPAARRVARERSINLSSLIGTGPGGRIVAEDVRRAADPSKPTSGQLIQEENAVPSQVAYAQHEMEGLPTVKDRIRLSAARRMIGERMAMSKRDVPHFYVNMDVDMGWVQETRESWKTLGETAIPSYNDFILWGSAQALKTFPVLNASLIEDEVTIFADINVGMATALEDSLIVPVIRNADRLSVRGISCKSKTLGERARTRKLAPADTEGGTFTVSNLGMFGVDSFAAIINPPQTAILAVGKIAPRVMTDGKSINIRLMTTLTLSVDHRVADGVMASSFLAAVKASLEKFPGEKA